MEAITLRELMEATGGKLCGEFNDLDVQITGAESDNRKIAAGDVFFAFPGEKADGHRFAGAALEAGAVGCVISKEPESFIDGKFYLMVEDTILAYGDLARYYRSKFNIPVIGVTGSVGKTTTKDMIASVLAQKYNTLKTEGNFNNNIGLPRTILRITSETQIAVIEMGMNHFGEIDYLVGIARPDAAVITNVGDAHIGNLGSRQGIFQAKSEIFNGLKEGGYAVMNADDEYLRQLKDDGEKLEKFRFTWVGEADDSSFRAIQIDDSGADGMSFTMRDNTDAEYRVEVPTPGRHMIYPAATAAAIGTYFGLTPEQITEGIRSYVPTKMRMETLHLPGNITVFNDTYNANPQSMKAGLQTLSRADADRKIAIVGDMGELGEEEERLHREVGKFAAQLPIDMMITVGAASKAIAEEAAAGIRDVRPCGDKEEAKAILREILAKDSEDQGSIAFLCKASRFMALEELTAEIRAIADGANG